MSNKRFKLDYEEDDAIFIVEDDDIVYPIRNDTIKEYQLQNLVDKLNEQQELIEELHISDHMGWGRAEHFEKELKQKKIYIKRLEYKVQKFKEMNDEQQATIHKLQDLCGESDGENAKLRIENKRLCDEIKLLKPTNIEQYEQIQKLQQENEQLKNELGKEKSLREYSDSMYGADLIVNIRFSNGEWRADVSVIDDE